MLVCRPKFIVYNVKVHTPQQHLTVNHNATHSCNLTTTVRIKYLNISIALDFMYDVNIYLITLTEYKTSIRVRFYHAKDNPEPTLQMLLKRFTNSFAQKRHIFQMKFTSLL